MAWHLAVGCYYVYDYHRGLLLCEDIVEVKSSRARISSLSQEQARARRKVFDKESAKDGDPEHGSQDQIPSWRNETERQRSEWPEYTRRLNRRCDTHRDGDADWVGDAEGERKCDGAKELR